MNKESNLDPLLLFQLQQCIKNLSDEKPGRISEANIKRLSEIYEFETFTEQTADNVERLTIAGVLLVLDIDFTNDKVTSAMLSLVTDHKEKTEDVSGVSEEDSMSLLYQSLKQVYSITSNASEMFKNLLTNANEIAENKDVVAYNGSNLKPFVANLKYLSSLDKLSLYSDTQSLPEADSAVSDNDNENVDLFALMNEYSLLFQQYHCAQSKKSFDELSTSSDKISQIFDILNGTHVAFKPIINLNNELGIFLKYWQDNRLLKYRKLEKSVDSDGDTQMVSQDNLNDIVAMYETICDDEEGSKFIKVSVCPHFSNSLFGVDELLIDKKYTDLIKSVSEMPPLSSDDSANTLKNIDFLSSIKFNPSQFLHVVNKDVKASLIFEFKDPVWVPADLIKEIFQDYATLNEAPLKHKSLENGKFRSKKRNNMSELFIDNYNDQFVQKKTRHKIEKKKATQSNLERLLASGSIEQKMYNLPVDAQVFDTTKTKIDCRLRFNINFESKLTKLKSFNYYRDAVERTCTDNNNLDIVKEQIYVYKEKSHFPSIYGDCIPLITENSITFLNNDKIDTINAVQARDSFNKKPICLIESLETLVSHLRSISFVWNLIDSLVTKCGEWKEIESEKAKKIPKRRFSNRLDSISGNESKGTKLSSFLQSIEDSTNSNRFMNVEISTRPSTVDRVGEWLSKQGFASSSVYNLNISTNLPLSKAFGLKNDSFCEINFTIYNGKFLAASLKTVIETYSTIFDDEASEQHKTVGEKLLKILKAVSLTEDLYFVLCKMLS